MAPLILLRRVTLALALVALAFIGCPFAPSLTAAEVQASMIPNPGFETDLDHNSRPDSWDWPTSDWHWDGSIVHSGSHSARVQKNDSGRSTASLWSEHVAISPSTYYTLTLWLRTQNATSDPSILIYQYDAAHNQNTAHTLVRVSVGGGTLNWHPISLSFQTQPDSAFVRIRLYLWNADNGTFWFDDVDLQAGGSATYPFQAGFPVTADGPVWFSSPALVDLEGNGSNELVVGDGVGHIHAWASNGNPRPGFPYDTGHERVGPLAVGDLTGDGDLEIVVGTRANYDGGLARVFALHHNGTSVAGWPKTVAWNTNGSDGRCEVYAAAVFDLDGDGDLEIIAGTSNNAGDYPGTSPPPTSNLYAWHHNGTLVAGSWPAYYGKGGIFGAVAVGDLGDDGTANVITGRDHFYLHAYRANGTELPGWPAKTYLNGPSGTWGVDDYAEFTHGAPILADLDRNGKTEYVITGKLRDGPTNVTQNSALFVMDADGQRHVGWELPALGGAPLDNSFYRPYQAPTVADLDHNGDLEIIVPNFDGYLRVYDHDKTLRWSFDFAQGEILYASEAIVGDVNADGRLEILFGTYDPTYGDTAVHLWGLDVNGGVLPGYPLPVASHGIRAAPTLGDLDGDGDLEIVVAGLSGHVYVWDTPTLVNSIHLSWPTGRYDAQRSAWFRWTDPNLGMTIKQVQPPVADEGEIATYTIKVRNVGGYLAGVVSVTDTIPIGLEYVADSLQVSPAIGMGTLNDRTLTWQGEMEENTLVTISYQTRVVTDSITALTNTAIINAAGFAPLARSATFIANGYATYLPTLSKNALLVRKASH